MLIKISAIYIIVTGFIGLSVNFYVAALLLSTESIYSPHLGKRIFYRYFIFSLYYTFSFFFTIIPIAFDTVQEWLSALAWSGQTLWFVYLLCCIPLACLMFYGHCQFAKWTDKQKIYERDRLAKMYRQGKL